MAIQRAFVIWDLSWGKKKAPHRGAWFGYGRSAIPVPVMIRAAIENARCIGGVVHGWRVVGARRVVRRRGGVVRRRGRVIGGRRGGIVVRRRGRGRIVRARGRRVRHGRRVATIVVGAAI